MTSWFWYAVAAALLYGAHQIFTKLAAHRIGEGLGGFVVEATAALSIFLYLVFLRLSGSWNQKFSACGFNYSLLTGVCVGAATIAFFSAFSKGRSTLFRSRDSGWRCGNHGYHRDLIFS
jgi:transporter family protein